MSGYRSSFVFCIEDKFKGGKPADKSWILPPPGSFISTTHNRTVDRIYTQGSKFYDTLAYGQLSGSWEWTFEMDYKYLEPFLLAFEDSKYDSSTGTWTFKKSNNKRVPSFCVRRKVLNRMTGDNGDDETVILKGMVVKTIRFSKPGGSSQLSVSLSGFYADESADWSDLENTDYQEYSGQLVEFSCMYIGAISDANYVANTESLSLGIETSASAIFSVCTPFASNYSESQTSFTFGTTTYSNDPSKYKRRLYSGGSDNSRSVTRPKSKGMKPIPVINLASFDGEIRESEIPPENDVSKSVYTGSTNKACFTLYNTSIKSLTWQKGDGSKLQDQINSVDCQRIDLTVVSDYGEGVTNGNIWSASNPHALKEVPPSMDGTTSEETSNI